mgnify:CR=1 FL=1
MLIWVKINKGMKKRLIYLRIFLIALSSTVAVVLLKYILHQYNWEVIEQTSLHNSVISSVIFVIGFLLSATIADYKESEKIPAEFASTVENMYEDARSIHQTYDKFDLDAFRRNLIDILAVFRDGARKDRHKARRKINELNEIFTEMEQSAKVPANFIVKLKQQQAQLLRSIFRINYIQKIKFIPSAFILARSIVVIIIGLLIVTNIDPFYGGLALTGTISFILIYMIVLIQTVSVPFHPEGKTQDDVSLFLLREATQHLSAEKTPKNK